MREFFFYTYNQQVLIRDTFNYAYKNDGFRDILVSIAIKIIAALEILPAKPKKNYSFYFRS